MQSWPTRAVPPPSANRHRNRFASEAIHGDGRFGEFFQQNPESCDFRRPSIPIEIAQVPEPCPAPRPSSPYLSAFSPIQQKSFHSRFNQNRLESSKRAENLQTKSRRDFRLRCDVAELEREMANLGQKTDDYVDRIQQQTKAAAQSLRELQEMADLKQATFQRLAPQYSISNVGKSVKSSKYNGFDYEAMQMKIADLRKSRLQLEKTEKGGKGTFRKAIFVEKGTVFSSEKKKIGKKRRDTKENQMKENIGYESWLKSHQPRNIVRQTRTRPSYLQEITDQPSSYKRKESERKTSVNDVVIDKTKIDSKMKEKSSEKGTIDDEIVEKKDKSEEKTTADASLQTDRLACDQSTITEISPPPIITFDSMKFDSESISSAIPLSVLDFDENEEFVPAKITRKARADLGDLPSYLDNRVLLGLILQLFSSASLRSEPISRTEPYINQDPLVQVNLVMITANNHPILRLSISILNTSPNLILCADQNNHEPREKSVEEINLIEEKSVEEINPIEEKGDREETEDNSDLDEEIEETTQIGKTKEKSEKSEKLGLKSGKEALRPSPSIELRTSSLSRNLSQAGEIVQIQDLRHESRQLDYLESQLENDENEIEAQIIQPIFEPVSPDPVIVMILVIPPEHEVIVVIKLTETPFVCFGPQLNPPEILQESDAKSVTSSGRIIDGERSLEDYLENCADESSSGSSSERNSGTGSGRWKGLGSSGELLYPREIGEYLSEGEIMPSLSYPQDRLEYSSDSTDFD